MAEKRKSRGESGFGSWLAGGSDGATITSAAGDNAAETTQWRNCIPSGKSLLRSVVAPQKKLKNTTNQDAAAPSEADSPSSVAPSSSSIPTLDRIGKALQQYVVNSSALGSSKQRLYDNSDQRIEPRCEPPIETVPIPMKAHTCLQGFCR
jgi:hypothetical protein